MKKGILIFLIFFLIIATTLTKNSTKKIDQKIFEKRENIILLKNKYELVLLDYNYLSSPKKLIEYQKKFFENDLIPSDIVDFEKIDFSNKEILNKKSGDINEK